VGENVRVRVKAGRVLWRSPTSYGPGRELDLDAAVVERLVDAGAVEIVTSDQSPVISEPAAKPEKRVGERASGRVGEPKAGPEGKAGASPAHSEGQADGLEEMTKAELLVVAAGLGLDPKKLKRKSNAAIISEVRTAEAASPKVQETRSKPDSGGKVDPGVDGVVDGIVAEVAGANG
jgi:hypothetical protein